MIVHCYPKAACGDQRRDQKVVWEDHEILIWGKSAEMNNTYSL